LRDSLCRHHIGVNLNYGKDGKLGGKRLLYLLSVCARRNKPKHVFFKTFAANIRDRELFYCAGLLIFRNLISWSKFLILLKKP
jgi:hypothetical protein